MTVSVKSAIPEASKQESALPEYEYPVHVIVRNTFLDTKDARPISLEQFFEERRVHSSPVVPQAPRTASDDSQTPEPQALHDSITTGAQAFMTKVAAATGFWTATPTGSEYDAPWQHEEYSTRPGPVFRCDAPLQRPESLESLPEPELLPGMESFDMAQEMPRVLMLSDALPEPALGSRDVPTVGSAAHYAGACKPCAFLYTKGCGNGVQCPFCHLCPPDEKRRRQKEKHAAFREIRRQRRQVRL